MTVSRQSAFDAATGIGFYISSSGQRWIGKGDLIPVMTTATASGEQGTVHRFAVLFTGQPMSALLFKPFISFSGDGNIYNVWENLTPRAGRDYVTGSVGGSGDYRLISGRIDAIAHPDLLRDPDQIVFPGVRPALGEVRGDNQPIDIVTGSLDGGSLTYQAALFPYVYGQLLDMQQHGFVEAGKRLWIRVNDPRAEGRTVSLRFTVDGGAEQEASEYLGGNCYGFARCFEIKPPAEAQEAITFRVYLTGTDGSVLVVDANGAAFRTPIMPSTNAKVTVTSAGVDIVGLQPEATAMLTYDVQRAVVKALAQGSYPGYIQVKARIKGADGSATTVPLGGISAGRDDHFRFTYRGSLGIVPIMIPANSATVEIDFLLECYRNGSSERVAVDQVFIDIP